MKEMKFLDMKMPTLDENLLKSSQFVMKSYNKVFKNDETLLQKLWDMLSQKGISKVDIQKLTLVILSFYNLQQEMVKNYRFDLKKTAQEFRSFKE